MPFTVASGVAAATVLLRIATAAPEKSLAAPSEGLGALDATADRVARSQSERSAQSRTYASHRSSPSAGPLASVTTINLYGQSPRRARGKVRGWPRSKSLGPGTGRAAVACADRFDEIEGDLWRYRSDPQVSAPIS